MASEITTPEVNVVVEQRKPTQKEKAAVIDSLMALDEAGVVVNLSPGPFGGYRATLGSDMGNEKQYSGETLVGTLAGAAAKWRR